MKTTYTRKWPISFKKIRTLHFNDEANIREVGNQGPEREPPPVLLPIGHGPGGCRCGRESPTFNQLQKTFSRTKQASSPGAPTGSRSCAQPLLLPWLAKCASGQRSHGRFPAARGSSRTHAPALEPASLRPEPEESRWAPRENSLHLGSRISAMSTEAIFTTRPNSTATCILPGAAKASGREGK